MNAETVAALAEADPAIRSGMYLDLQRKVQESSPIVIMFQATYQVGMAAGVSGYVNGATSDFVFYRLVNKD